MYTYMHMYMYIYIYIYICICVYTYIYTYAYFSKTELQKFYMVNLSIELAFENLCNTLQHTATHCNTLKRTFKNHYLDTAHIHMWYTTYS